MFFSEGAEALAEAAQRDCRQPIPGKLQSQFRWGNQIELKISHVIAENWF